MTPFVFFGTGPFAARVLSLLIERYRLAPAQVVSAADRPQGRGQRPAPLPAARVARSKKIALLTPARPTPSLKQELAPAARRLIVLTDYGRMIPGWLLRYPVQGMLNLHPSLLPRWRGAAPIQHALLSGDVETGVTLIRMDEELDHGPIIAQKKIPLRPKDTPDQLIEKLAFLGAALVSEILTNESGQEIKARAQNHAKATYAPRLTRADGRIDWRQPAALIERQVRALQPWPGAYAFFAAGGGTAAEKRLKILAARPAGDKPTSSPGTIFAHRERLLVGTGTGPLELLAVRPEGKKTMTGREFIHGHRRLRRLT